MLHVANRSPIKARGGESRLTASGKNRRGMDLVSSAVKAAATKMLFEIEKSGMDADLRHEVHMYVYQLLDRIEVVREANERSDGRSKFPADEKTVSNMVATTLDKCTKIAIHDLIVNNKLRGSTRFQTNNEPCFTEIRIVQDRTRSMQLVRENKLVAMYSKFW